MEAKLDMVLEQVGRDKNIDKSVLINALEQAILTAAKRTFGLNREMEAKFNSETGSVDLFLIVNVVEEDDAIEGREITVSEAHKAGLEADLGDELLFQVFYRAEDGLPNFAPKKSPGFHDGRGVASASSRAIS